MNYIFINDSIKSNDDPVIHANDRGFLLGDGLFETIKAVNGKLVFFAQHYARLQASAHKLDSPLCDDFATLKNQCQQLLVQNKLHNKIAAIRITLTRGMGQRGIDISQNTIPTLLINAQAYDDAPKKCIRMTVTDIKRNEYSPLTQLKTINYLESIMARKLAKARGFDEGLMLNTQGMITESSVANVFFIIDDVIITPPISDGVLPGIIRQRVLECCVANNIAYEERSVLPNQLAQVTAAFQTNSLIGMQLISCFDDIVMPELDSNHIIKRLKNHEA